MRRGEWCWPTNRPASCWGSAARNCKAKRWKRTCRFCRACCTATELQVRMLIETSPLAILTLDAAGRVVLANESARQLLGFDSTQLQGEEVEAYLPILPRMLH